jgi:hypothetical protein
LILPITYLASAKKQKPILKQIFRISYLYMLHYDLLSSQVDVYFYVKKIIGMLLLMVFNCTFLWIYLWCRIIIMASIIFLWCRQGHFITRRSFKDCCHDFHPVFIFDSFTCEMWHKLLKYCSIKTMPSIDIV